MKIFKKIALTFLLLVVCCSPLILTGCFGDDPVEPKIEITTEFKTNYMLGEDLDVTGGILEYTNEKGKSISVAITSQMVTGFNSSSVGTRQVVVTYEDCTALVTYTVSPYDIDTTTFYWAHDELADGTRTYEYLKINEDLDIYMNSELVSSSSGPDASKNNIELYSKLTTLTRSIENNKVVYSGYYLLSGSNSTATVVITVENKNTITVKIESTVEAFQNELTFTKF